MRKRIVDILCWVGIFLCCVLLVGALVGVKGAFAQKLVQGVGLICDTKEQILKYAENPDNLEAVNAEVGSSACGIAPVMFIIGEKFGQVRIKGEAYEITQVLVVGAFNGTGWQRLPPMPQFTLLKIKEEGA